MTHSRGVCGGRMFARVHGVRPYGFEDKADCLYRLSSPHQPRAVPLPLRGRLGWYVAVVFAVGGRNTNRYINLKINNKNYKKWSKYEAF